MADKRTSFPIVHLSRPTFGDVATTAVPWAKGLKEAGLVETAVAKEYGEWTVSCTTAANALAS